jgi:type I restriction enzyme R subunit
MAYTDINSEDRLVQQTFAEHLEQVLGWESVYAWNQETFGPSGALGRNNEREVVLVRYLRAALVALNQGLPVIAIDQAVQALTTYDYSRSLLQHNQAFYKLMRDGVPVTYRDDKGQKQEKQVKVLNFDRPLENSFLVVRELKITGLRTPNYNRRADLICYVNGLPLVFIELKAIYKNIRAGYDGNLRDYLDENVLAHAFHHNAFVIVSNGDQARYGSVTSGWEHFGEWKRLSEQDKGSVNAEVLLNGMLDKTRLMDLVENYILFDAGKAGAVRKIVARNHQYLGVNQSVAAVVKQEQLKLQFPPEQRLQHRLVKVPANDDRFLPKGKAAEAAAPYNVKTKQVHIIERAHPDLGRLGIVWHTQGSGKSYSMIFFAEKVRRTIPGNFTFVLMTDRNDLDSQIYRTFVGCGIADDNTPRASSGKELEQLLKQNHRYVFSLIHKFNQDVKADNPYSERDDIIVISDEAHRTQSGKLARNMRLALPNAAFIGFTGTPLFNHDEITRRIFGNYVSRYDFKRSEEDGATVKLVYENRGEKLGLAKLDLNDKIAEAIEKAELNPDQEARLEKLLGQDYEVITADDRLEKIAADFVEHCSTRWESGKTLFVCIDKLTCARMLMLIEPLWKAKALAVRQDAEAKSLQIANETHPELRQQFYAQRDRLLAKAHWLEQTIIEIIISEEQNEVARFKEWGFDIIPHRETMKKGFETPDGKRVDVETAFKDQNHPFRVAIVCAMWLTGFDVECLSSLYIDKPMRAHTLMQAIARANRQYPGKDFGLIIDYNGMLKALRAALAQYALGDNGNGEEDVVLPIEERVNALLEAIELTEEHLLSLGFDANRLIGGKGFIKIEAFKDAVEAIYKGSQPRDASKDTSTISPDEAKRRFEILARIVFSRFKALLMEPSAFVYAERHDNIEAIYKKLSEKRDAADITALLKELHRIVNEAIRAQKPGEDHVENKQYDLSKIDLEKLRDELSKKVKRSATALQDVLQLLEQKLARMLAINPKRMDYYKKYQAIIADYNADKDRISIEETFAKVMDLFNSLDEEQVRCAKEGLSEEQLAVFEMLEKGNLSPKQREHVKQASRTLLAEILALISPLDQWTEKKQTQAEVEILIRDRIYQTLPDPPYTLEDKKTTAEAVYQYIWQQSRSGTLSDRE